MRLPSFLLALLLAHTVAGKSAPPAIGTSTFELTDSRCEEP